jgi:hypothetical protein
MTPPKIHVDNPTVGDHAITFPETGFRIPMSFWGIFSYFPTTKPTALMMQESDEVYLLTPPDFNPHDDAYAANKDNMTDWEGNMIEKRHRTQILLSEIDEDSLMEASAVISSIKTRTIDCVLEHCNVLEEKDTPQYQPIPRAADEISSILASVSPVLDDTNLYARLSARSELGKFKASIGSTDAPSSAYLMEDYNAVATQPSTDESDSEDSDENDDDDEHARLLDEIYDKSTKGEIDLDDYLASAAHAQRTKGMDAAHLSKVWRISLDQAERTLGITTQTSVRTDDPKLSRNYGTNDRMPLRYKRINDYFFMDTFFATKKAGKSSRQNTCCQLFVTDRGFVYVIPMTSKSEVLQAVKEFANRLPGAPDTIIVCDAAREQKSMSLRKFLGDIGTTLRVLEEETPWANKAELYIGLIKEAVRKDMKNSDCPLAFWDYCVERRARINNMTAKDMFKLHGSNAHTALTGDEGDISNLCQYKWYEWCYFRDHKNQFPFNREVLGHVIGPLKGEGNEMAQWILKANGNVVPCRSSRPLKPEEVHSEQEQAKRKVFDDLIERRWGSSINPPMATEPEFDPRDDFEEYEDDNELARVVPGIEDTVNAHGKLLNQHPAYDQIINAEVSLQLGDDMVTGTVTQVIGPDRAAIGSYDNNAYINLMIYEVEFPDGQIKEYAANIIAENTLTQVDSDGFSTSMMEGIINYKKDDAVAIWKNDMYVVTRRGQKRIRKTTQGWKLLIKWANGSESWIALKDMKESHPVETTEFARARDIDAEPAFTWCVPYTLQKRDIILSKIGNSLWCDALALEMTRIGIAFEVLAEGKPAPPGWKKVTGHLIWDLKMDFTQKAHWILDGHKTPDPIGSTYTGVVSRESVRTAFTYAALNAVDICAVDIRNAHLQAPSSCKDYVLCGPKFGLENVGTVALIHRDLYGGKSAGRDFRNRLRSCMRYLDFISCPADPDVRMRPAKHSNGTDYYEYILLYTNDALVVGENSKRILREELGPYFELKESSIGAPKIYLGGNVRKV